MNTIPEWILYKLVYSEAFEVHVAFLPAQTQGIDNNILFLWSSENANHEEVQEMEQHRANVAYHLATKQTFRWRLVFC